MPEPVAGEVIVLDFGNQDRLEGMPFADPVSELRADFARLLARETGNLDHQLANLTGQSYLVPVQSIEGLDP